MSAGRRNDDPYRFRRGGTLSALSQVHELETQLRRDRATFAGLVADDYEREHALMVESCPIVFDDDLAKEIRGEWIAREGIALRKRRNLALRGGPEKYLIVLAADFCRTHPEAIGCQDFLRRDASLGVEAPFELFQASTWLAAVVGSGVIGGVAYDQFRSVVSRVRGMRGRRAKGALEREQALALAYLVLSVVFFASTTEDERPDAGNCETVGSFETEEGWHFALKYKSRLFDVRIPRDDPVQARYQARQLWGQSLAREESTPSPLDPW